MNTDKYTDFLSNTTIHFIATQLHVSVHYRNIIRLSNKKNLKTVNMHAKYKLHEVYTLCDGSVVDRNMYLCCNKATNEVYYLYTILPFYKKFLFDSLMMVL
jgi:hypothetical protein